MKKYIYLCGLVLLFATACNNNTQEAATTNAIDTQQTNTPTTAPVDDAIAKNAAFKQIDALEKLFDNQNYLNVEGKDSSYIYFSRLGKANFYTHRYVMQKGDSERLVIDTIQVNAANKVQWHWRGKQLVLNGTTDFSSVWVANDKDTVLFQKIDNNTIQFVEGGQKKRLIKTPTLSVFLVRSYYDYTHGTHLAFDSTNFTKKH